MFEQNFSKVKFFIQTLFFYKNVCIWKNFWTKESDTWMQFSCRVDKYLQIVSYALAAALLSENGMNNNNDGVEKNQNHFFPLSMSVFSFLF